ncbi:MAG: ABC transporter permease subunit [Oscillospiraceae bacterium]|nr:ABC transporter permease subunit [Oscillospiraceae bacterium]
MSGQPAVALNSGLRKKGLLFRIWESRYIYLFLLPGVAFFVIFKYIPIYGVQLAFKKYEVQSGITGSPWIGLYNFEFLFIDVDFITAVRNTLIIAFMQIAFFYPFPIILAMLLNEIRMMKYKRVVQTIYTLPHFLSWVIVGGMILNLFGSGGAITNLLRVITGGEVTFLTNKSVFRQLLVGTLLWKEAGWSCILYLASITAIDPTLYEAATIDGANRWHKMRYVTWPGISMIVIVTFILRVGSMMNAGFEQIINIYNPTVYSVADIIDTYVYRITFQRPANFGVSTAVGLFKGLTNCILLVTTNAICVRISGEGIV